MNPTRCSIRRAFVALALLAVGLGACQSTYYKTMEAFGKHKREILVDRVKEARGSQENAKEEFKDALTSFREVTGFQGGELEKKYDKLKTELDRCQTRARDVTTRIDSVDDVSNALFDEWEGEIKQYKDSDLQAKSRAQFKATKERYNELLNAMRRAEATMKPVLDTFNDHVLFLKHNLNAEAIASLKGEVASIEADVSKLIRDMEASIAEADAFIQTMDKSS
jgi:hypothetical protein